MSSKPLTTNCVGLDLITGDGSMMKKDGKGMKKT